MIQHCFLHKNNLNIIGEIDDADEASIKAYQANVDFSVEAKRLTDGKGVHVVYDSVGASTFMKSLDSLRPRGMMVTFGNASGAVPAIEPLLLNQKGSLFLTRPTLAHHCLDKEELNWRAGDVLGWIAAGKLSLHIGGTYPLANVGQAHIDLASRKTTGTLMLSL